MKRARTWGWAKTPRYDGTSSDLGPSSSPHQSCPDCIIATRGYDFREGQGFLLHLRTRRTRSVRRLIRNLTRSPRPAPVDRFLERPSEHENDEHEHNADHDDLPLRNRANRAHARGHPDAGCRGEPVHALAFLVFNNTAPTEKPDA